MLVNGIFLAVNTLQAFLLKHLQGMAERLQHQESS